MMDTKLPTSLVVPLLVALIGLMGGLGGYLLNSRLEERSTGRLQLAERKREIYSQYMTKFTTFAFSGLPRERMAQAKTDLDAAISDVMLIAPDNVMREMVHARRLAFDSPTASKAIAESFFQVVKLMREDYRGELSGIPASDLSCVLIQCL